MWMMRECEDVERSIACRQHSQPLALALFKRTAFRLKLRSLWPSFYEFYSPSISLIILFLLLLQWMRCFSIACVCVVGVSLDSVELKEINGDSSSNSKSDSR